MSLNWAMRGVVRHFELVILDCDGVIFDANRFKTDAFRMVLSAYPTHAVDEFVAYHQAHGGVSRYAKFEHFFSRIHWVAENERAKCIHRALDEFAAFVRASYDLTPPRKEALDLIMRPGLRSICYVVSGSDQEELRAVFRNKGLDRHVAGVYGSPVNKLAHTRRLMESSGSLGSSVVVIGDGRADYEAARSVGGHFIYLQEMSDWKGGAAQLAGLDDVSVVGTWGELLARIRPVE